VNRQHQVNPLHVYEELRPRPYRDSPNPATLETAVSALYLKIKSDQGLEGLYGPIDREAAVRDAFGAAGLEVLSAEREGDWVALDAARPAADPAAQPAAQRAADRGRATHGP
jgi:4-alpha-glucanotransferase